MRGKGESRIWQRGKMNGNAGLIKSWPTRGEPWSKYSLSASPCIRPTWWGIYTRPDLGTRCLGKGMSLDEVFFCTQATLKALTVGGSLMTNCPHHWAWIFLEGGVGGESLHLPQGILKLDLRFHQYPKENLEALTKMVTHILPSVLCRS